MIAKIALPIILTILLSSLYHHWHCWRRLRWWQGLLAWLPSLTAIAVTAILALTTDEYFPRSLWMVEAFLAMTVVIVAPLALTALAGAAGSAFHRRKTGQRVGAVLSIVAIILYAYGATVGFSRLEVRHVDLAFDDLPEAFDGYRIVQFSDAHVGTYTGWRSHLLQKAVDSINAQHADAIIFTGDLQNVRPQELLPHMPVLSSLRAADGVFSVMGNHDYAEYTNLDFVSKVMQAEQTVSMEEKMGWTMLNNWHRKLRRGRDSLIIAGMENDGEGRFPQKGNLGEALRLLGRDCFIVMLEHDPTSWRRKILRQCHAQLTLSGHTHAGQLSIFGWSPVSLRYREYDGLYQIGDRKLFVSRGLGGLIPFRLGASGEIVVITLHRKARP